MIETYFGIWYSQVNNVSIIQIKCKNNEGSNIKTCWIYLQEKQT